MVKNSLMPNQAVRRKCRSFTSHLLLLMRPHPLSSKTVQASGLPISHAVLTYRVSVPGPASLPELPAMPLLLPNPCFWPGQKLGLGRTAHDPPGGRVVGVCTPHTVPTSLLVLMQSGGQVSLQDGAAGWYVKGTGWAPRCGWHPPLRPGSQPHIHVLWPLPPTPSFCQSPGCSSSHAVLLERGLRTTGMWIPQHPSTQCRWRPAGPFVQSPPRPVCWTLGTAIVGASPCCACGGGHQPRHPGLSPVFLHVATTPLSGFHPKRGRAGHGSDPFTLLGSPRLSRPCHRSGLSFLFSSWKRFSSLVCALSSEAAGPPLRTGVSPRLCSAPPVTALAACPRAPRRWDCRGQ